MTFLNYIRELPRLNLTIAPLSPCPAQFSELQFGKYALPFLAESFSFVYSLGVLQHTPDVANAFFSLVPFITEGGALCVDFYERSFRRYLLPKYWLRPLTKRMDKRRLFILLKKTVPILYLISCTLGSVPLAGRLLKRLVPVANYKGIYPLRPNQLREWALLDTFDWFSPAYDKPQTFATVHRWFEQAGFKEIEVLKVGHLVGRGRKPHVIKR